MAITDMIRPKITGDRPAVANLEMRPDIPVILCAGYSKRISEKGAREFGIKTDLAKTIRKVPDDAEASAGG